MRFVELPLESPDFFPLAMVLELVSYAGNTRDTQGNSEKGINPKAKRHLKKRISFPVPKRVFVSLPRRDREGFAV